MNFLFKYNYYEHLPEVGHINFFLGRFIIYKIKMEVEEKGMEVAMENEKGTNDIGEFKDESFCV